MQTIDKECHLEQQQMMLAVSRSIELIQDTVNQAATVCSLALACCHETVNVNHHDTWNLMLCFLHKMKGQCDVIELTVLDELQG